MALVVLSACTPTHLESGRYACEPGLPDQCPGAWRCGLEGYCHQLGNTTVAWRCETNADCEGGFSCGLSKSGEFRECHDPSAPRAYDCATDEDCVGGWRCGTEAVCVDPSEDALGVLVLAGVSGGTHVNSLRSTSPLSRLSVSPFFTEGSGRGRGNAVFVQDAHLRAMSLDVSRGVVGSYDLGTVLPTAFLAHGARGITDELIPHPDELERVSAVWADGSLSIFSFADGGVPDEVAWSGLPQLDTLSQGSGSGLLLPSVFGFQRQSGQFYARIRGDGVGVYALDTVEGANFYEVPGNRLRSVTSLKFSDALECVYVVDDRGLWVSQRGGTLPSGDIIASWDFEPVNLPSFTHTECLGSQGPKIDSVIALGDRWLAVTATTQPGAPVRVSVLDAARTWLVRGGAGSESLCATLASEPCTEDDRIPVDVAMGPCEACPRGLNLVSQSLVAGPPGSVPALEVVCGQPGLPGSVYQLTAGASVGACSRRPIVGPSSYFSAPSPAPGLPAPGGVAWSGPAGELWYGTDAAHVAALTFDRAPTGMVRRGSGPEQYLAFTEELTGVPTASMGLMSTHAPQLSAAVAWAPNLAVSGSVLIQLGNLEKTIGFTNATELASPVHASLTRSTQGSRWAVVSAGATLYAGDVETTLASSSPPSAITQRLTLPAPISALAWPREAGPSTGPLLSGYAVSGENVLRVVADTVTRWHSEAVPLPLTLTPLAVWFQGVKARVGFHDGSVFSLPSRVRISQPLPAGDAVDFAQACGQQLALAPDGLFRLETDGSSPVGQWRRLELPPEVSGLDFTEGRVHGLGPDVFVFTRTGEAARLTFDTCPE